MDFAGQLESARSSPCSMEQKMDGGLLDKIMEWRFKCKTYCGRQLSFSCPTNKLESIEHSNINQTLTKGLFKDGVVQVGYGHEKKFGIVSRVAVTRSNMYVNGVESKNVYLDIDVQLIYGYVRNYPDPFEIGSRYFLFKVVSTLNLKQRLCKLHELINSGTDCEHLWNFDTNDRNIDETLRNFRSSSHHDGLFSSDSFNHHQREAINHVMQLLSAWTPRRTSCNPVKGSITTIQGPPGTSK